MVTHGRLRRALQGSRRDLAVVAIVACWIALVLRFDVESGIWAQRALGAATWLVLVALLRRETAATRAQVAVVVLFATAVEYTAAPLLGFYTYRLENVPAFVPPGHGVVYLAALALGRSSLFAAARRPICGFALFVAGAWALWGAALAGRADLLGLILYVVFVRFVLRGRVPLVYAAAFVITSSLELLGTWLGTWTWAHYDPTGLVSIGNPPSGIPGGYCVFDAVGLAGGPVLLQWLDRVRRKIPARVVTVSPRDYIGVDRLDSEPV